MKSPTHLAGCTEPLKEEENKKVLFIKRYDLKDENKYVGKVKCPCGSHTFELLYPGGAGNDYPCSVEIEGNFFFIVKAKCTSCGKEHLLFDADFHGWDGWICHDEKQANLPRPNLIKWKCKRCSSTRHSAIVIINSQGKDDFIEEAGGGFDLERWPDAFDWFTLDIKCEDCNHEDRNFISYETM